MFITGNGHDKNGFIFKYKIDYYKNGLNYKLKNCYDFVYLSIPQQPCQNNDRDRVRLYQRPT